MMPQASSAASPASFAPQIRPQGQQSLIIQPGPLTTSFW